jgi:hypothetical protein
MVGAVRVSQSLGEVTSATGAGRPRCCIRQADRQCEKSLRRRQMPE